MSVPFRLEGFDHVGMIVGNAKQAAVYYQERFGFEPIAYKGLETGSREVTCHVLRQGRVLLVLETPMTPDHPHNAHLAKHGDAVKDLAFTVDDARAAFAHTTGKGARPVREPEVLEDEHGTVVIATIATYGDTTHTFVERRGYKGDFLPGYEPRTSPKATRSCGLEFIDHVVGNQGDREMEDVARWYEEIFDFHRIWTVDDKDVSTEFTSLRSVVVANENESVKMPINEPAEGKKKSQIQEYVESNYGPGVQHVALYTKDIVETIGRLTENGVEFLQVPDTYYEALRERVGDIDEDIRELQKFGILVDRDDRGYLLQLFTKPVQDRPTLFYEIIERKGARSFGKGNFKALFESIEREQALRGNL
ncbi:MAG TPA: 4-hydroxyphenylpyruvate dioxygenase [Candidatus Krumholzibacteria bacterium]|nr:4-hydroxyphenylpyruvate dioxygenase [Candidatus Krumholzibacteria bacterium]HRX51754.1 4-hydroxyphenylpyruvate dioxygenase [Candidatus Krumholzibacteria bacterium]